ncbi:Monocarboxylate transporter 14 [Echinococcus multilocularis]|uniref:Monocarboxylate transporter 14 n=1 Tax=Echinococcus multilocularis TaxID=6211 RepID=A0A068YFS3_ECHMU|nr:Monocarboxylate transporter 14 [Echinococcus multilocularis]
MGSNVRKTPASLQRRLIRVFDLTLFRNFSFLVLRSSFVVCQLAYFVPFAYFFTFALVAGLTRSSAMRLITTLGILHALGRLVEGALTMAVGNSSVIKGIAASLADISSNH